MALAAFLCRHPSQDNGSGRGNSVAAGINTGLAGCHRFFIGNDAAPFLGFQTRGGVLNQRVGAVADGK
jgi:hypothetical protein